MAQGQTVHKRRSRIAEVPAVTRSLCEALLQSWCTDLWTGALQCPTNIFYVPWFKSWLEKAHAVHGERKVDIILGDHDSILCCRSYELPADPMGLWTLQV